MNSAFLFALGAVSIPLIIHFLSKRRIRTIEFSSLKFLEQMQKSRMKWLKIKELLLLLMRMLVIALIVMAFARPTLRGFAGSSNASSSVALILDRSASLETQGETGSLFDEGRRTAARLSGSLEPGDMVSVIPCPSDALDQIPEPTNPGDRLLKNINDIDLSYSPGNIGSALASALNILGESPDLNREIYIISDMQKNAWENPPGEVLNRDFWKGINLTVIRLSPSGPDNVGITDILLPPQMLVPGENFEIEAELVNYGTGTIENALVGVVLDGERKAQATVSLRPGQPARVPFKIKLDKPGRHSGYAEIDYDRYSLDNRRYFTINMPDKIRLLAVGQTETSLKFLSLALNRPEAGQISFKGISAGDLLREDLGNYDVILIYDIKSLDNARQAAIKRFVNDGGGLFVSLGRSADRASWNSFLTNEAGISLGQQGGSPGEYILWDNFDFEHPIFSVYTSSAAERGKPAIPDIHVVYYMDLAGGRILGSSSSGVDLLAESTDEPILVFSSGLDLATGDLPAHSFFIPFLVRSMEYLGSRNTGAEADGIVGRLFSTKIGGITEGLKLISPSDEEIDINPTAADDGSMVKFTVAGPPGIYKLVSDSKTISLIAFNIDSRESSNENISNNEISEILGIGVNDIDPGSDIAVSVKNARFGKELWKEFLLLALILLAVESILGRTAPPRTAEKTV